MAGEQLKCVISGSFRFKGEIDKTIEIFERLGVDVLGPEKGTTQEMPSVRRRVLIPGYNPLKSERQMTPRQIEDSFLNLISRSDFLYLVDLKGYLGQMGGLELGFAYAAGVPIYAEEQVNWRLDPDLWNNPVVRTIKIMSPEMTVSDIIDRRRTVVEVP